MKKLLLAGVSMLAAVAAYGQGQVVFANTSATTFSTNGSSIGQGTGLLGVGAGQWQIGLYIAPDGTTAPDSFTLVATAANIAAPGRFQASNPPLTLAGNLGTPIAYQIRAWHTTAGISDYESAIAAGLYRGISAIGRVTPAVGGAPVPGLFGTGDFVGQLTSGAVLTPNPGVVPEPSTIALGLLGLGAVALFRRRK